MCRPSPTPPPTHRPPPRRQGLTPLFLAVALGTSPECVQLLVDAGADVNARALGAFTPLHVAAEGGKAGIAEVLLKVRARGAAPAGGGCMAGRARAGQHVTQGCMAAACGCCSDCRIPLCGPRGCTCTPLPARLPTFLPPLAPQAGADPQAKDEHGHTPARVAAMHNHRRLVELLLGRSGEGVSSGGGGEGASGSGSGAGAGGSSVDEFMASSKAALKEREAKVGGAPGMCRAGLTCPDCAGLGWPSHCSCGRRGRLLPGWPAAMQGLARGQFSLRYSTL